MDRNMHASTKSETAHPRRVAADSRGSVGAEWGRGEVGLKRTTLQYKMQKLGVTRMDYLD